MGEWDDGMGDSVADTEGVFFSSAGRMMQANE